ncbi:MAG: zinc-ribbon and DUF3426 domain-containing protein [Gammaproteobacteria bacterium]
MLAHCPHCDSVFRVAPETLDRARGLARCGLCLKVFDARVGLHEEREEAAVQVGDTVVEGPAVAAMAPAPAPERPAADAVPGTDPALGPRFPIDALDDLTPLRRPSDRRAAGWLWGLASLLLLGTLAAQLAWFRGQQILVRQPLLRDGLEQFCAWAPCSVPIPRDPEAVRLVSRDVRAHPRLDKALLVNAIVVNEAGFAQPYPVVQLGLYDTNGVLLAARRFRPDEYLEEGEPLDSLMQPGVPVHLVLELAGPSTPAVSFEFRFM